MINIAICDDDKNVVECICKYLEQKAEFYIDEQWNIFPYKSGEEFVNDINNGIMFHIVFMDIQMGVINGVEAGRILRNQNNGDVTRLIYVSSHNTYFEGIVHLGSFGFVGKPITLNKLDDVFSRALELVKREMQFQPKQFQYNINKEIFFIAQKDIVYLKVKSRSLEIYIWQNESKMISFLEKIYLSINSAMEQLTDEFFIQCERSHVVNIRYIQSVAGGKLTLIDEDKTIIPIGRAYKDRVKKYYTKGMVRQYG